MVVVSTHRWSVVSFSILLCLVRIQEVKSKRLVLFAGPHKAASTSVEQFFYTWAAGEHTPHTQGYKETFALRKWIWPHINGTEVSKVIQMEQEGGEGEEEKGNYKIFKYLVTDAETNPKLEEEILNGVKDAFENADSGIILGTEEFDRVGDQSFTYDGLQAVRKIVNHLGLEPAQVTVVLNYRYPRFDQWVSVWKHEAADKNNMTYEQFMCDQSTRDQRIESLATEMNPIQAAQVYVKEGYRVTLVDLAGADKYERDVSHVIACDILEAACDNGMLRHHTDYIPYENALDMKFASGLTDDDILLAEELFLYRDCAFQSYLENQNGFHIILDELVWATCSPSNQETYDKLLDARIIFGALLSQIQCPSDMPHGINKKNMISIEQALSGNVPELGAYVPGAQEEEKERIGGYWKTILPAMLMLALAYQFVLMNKKIQHYRTEPFVPNGGLETGTAPKAEFHDVEGGNNKVKGNAYDHGTNDDDDTESSDPQEGDEESEVELA